MSQGSVRRPLAKLAAPREIELAGRLGADPSEVSRYVADICGELSKMTKSAQLAMLSYLLSMVQQEAERIARAGSAK